MVWNDALALRQEARKRREKVSGNDAVKLCITQAKGASERAWGWQEWATLPATVPPGSGPGIPQLVVEPEGQGKGKGATLQAPPQPPAFSRALHSHLHIEHHNAKTSPLHGSPPLNPSWPRSHGSLVGTLDDLPIALLDRLSAVFWLSSSLARHNIPCGAITGFNDLEILVLDESLKGGNARNRDERRLPQKLHDW